MDKPTLTATSGGLAFAWADGVEIVLSRIKESARGTDAHWTFYQCNGSGERHRVTALQSSLTSLSARKLLVKHIMQLWADQPWPQLIEYVAVKAADELTKGEPVSELSGNTEGVSEAWVLSPLIPERHPGLLFGLGKTFKSYLATYAALLLSVGASEEGFATTPHRPLYLDWELEKEDLDVRVKMLKRGHPALARASLTYRRMTHPLFKQSESIQQTIRDHACSVLILDSLALAAGGAELERSEAAVQFYHALRELQRPALLVGHTAKGEQKGSASPFGSVFFFNLQRNAWEVRKVQEAGSRVFVVGLYHHGGNFGLQQPPMGFQISFEEPWTCRIQQIDVAEDPDLAGGLPLADRIAQLLGDGQGRIAKVIALELDASEGTIRKILSRYKGRRWFKTAAPDGKGEMWQRP